MQYRWVVLTVTTVGIFMASLDSSVIIVGLPTVIEDLHTTLAAGVWIITAYRLAITVLLVSIGRLADMKGRVKLYNIGFVIFTVGSGLCAIAPDALTLIVFRLIQGIGSSFLFANSMAIVTDAFPPEQLGTGIGINQMAINAGTIVGYTLSGVMISLFGWRSLFSINLPIGIFGTYWAHRRLKEISYRSSSESFDLTGSAIFTTAITILLLAMTVTSLGEIALQLLALIGAMIFALFVYVERRVKSPVLDMNLFRIREYSVGNFTNLLNGITFNSLAFLMSLYYQLARGFTPFQAGVALLSFDVTLILVGPVSGMLSDHFGARWLSSIGLAVTGFSFLLLRTIDIVTPEVFVFLMLAVAGFGIGFFRSPNASSVMASVPPKRRGEATGLRSTILNASNLVSVPFATLLMSFVIPYDQIATIISSSSPGQAQLELLMAAFKLAFLVSAVLNFAAAAVSPLRRSLRFRRASSTTPL